MTYIDRNNMPRYYKTGILELDDKDIKEWKICQSHGNGAQGGTPYYEGRTIRIIIGTEFDAWIIAEAMNIELNGIISTRNSWEDPTIQYKLIQK